jgi:hypothetical protein
MVHSRVGFVDFISGLFVGFAGCRQSFTGCEGLENGRSHGGFRSDSSDSERGFVYHRNGSKRRLDMD